MAAAAKIDSAVMGLSGSELPGAEVRVIRLLSHRAEVVLHTMDSAEATTQRTRNQPKTIDSKLISVLINAEGT